MNVMKKGRRNKDFSFYRFHLIYFDLKDLHVHRESPQNCPTNIHMYFEIKNITSQKYVIIYSTQIFVLVRKFFPIQTIRTPGY